jgi:hypothetical protein
MAFATYDAASKDYRCSQVAALADQIGASPSSCEPRDAMDKRAAGPAGV